MLARQLYYHLPVIIWTLETIEHCSTLVCFEIDCPYARVIIKGGGFIGAQAPDLAISLTEALCSILSVQGSSIERKLSISSLDDLK